MEIELRKETVHINEAVCCKSIRALAESDVIVPDTKSDIAKVLQLDSNATVDNVVTGEKGTEIAGHVDMTLLYVPEGDSKPVCALPITIDFVAEAESAELAPGCKCTVLADVNHVEYSVLNARKLSVRALVDLDLKCYCTKAVETVCEVDGGVETKRDSLQLYNLLHTSMLKFPLRESLAFPNGKPSAVCVLKADTKITDKETHVVTGKVVVRGNVQICTLYVSEANCVEFMEHELPFTEVIDAEGATEGCMCELDLNLAGAHVALSADADGDMRFLDVSLMCNANLTLSEVADLSLVTDCFSHDKNMVCKSEPLCVHHLAGTGSAQANVKGVMQLGANAAPPDTVYNVMAKPYVQEVEIGENVATVHGSMDCYLLYLSSSPAAPISTAKAQLPFSMPVQVEGLREGMDCEVCIETLHCAYNITMSGEIEIRCVLRADAKAIETKQVSLITGATLEEIASPLMHGILLYFVKPGDTLWEIAKHYRVPIALLKSVNKLENPDLIYPGQRLLIPNMPRA